MVREYSLSDVDDGVALFHPEAEKEIEKLDATQSQDALTAIINCLSNSAPDSVVEKTYETCAELQQLRQGDLRVYVKLVTSVPDYNVLWVFAVKKHRYRNIGKYDARACQKTAELETVSTPAEIEEYLAGEKALTVEQLRSFRDRL